MSNRATSSPSGAVGDLVDLLGAWTVGAGPLYRRLARSFAHAIERGALPNGARLPSERAVAAGLAVGRGTAVAAFDALVADGLIERRRGSGTYVVTAASALPEGREGTALVHRLVDRSEATADVVDLSISVVRDAALLPDVAVTAADLAAVEPDTGHTPWGLPALRQAVADHVSDWGLPTDPHQVVVTTGAQQAITAAAACWIRPGDLVVVDDPTYPGALAAFRQAGATVVGVPLDHHGVMVDGLASALARRPALVYLQSTVHSPTGTVLAASRRRVVAELLAAHRVPLVEDLALADLAWRDAPAPIASLLPDAPIAVVGSLSKLFWGGLRVGFVRAPEPLALRLARIKATHDLGSPVAAQLLALRLMDAGGAGHGPALVARMQERAAVLEHALHRALPSWTWQPPGGGLSLWVRLPGGVSAETFSQHALRHGVAVAPPSSLSVGGDDGDHLRLSFSGPSAELEEGVRRLAAAWHTWT